MKNLVDLQVVRGCDSIIRETDKAICLQWPVRGRVKNEYRPVWLPKSQITWLAPSACYEESIHIPLWLARAKSL